MLTINNGRISQHNATAAVRLRDVNLALGQPYLHDVLEPELYGLVDADMEVKWSGSGLPTLSIDRGAVRQFALKFPHALPKDAKSADIAAHDLPSWEILDITKGFVNPNDHSASAIKVILRSPSVMLHRNAKKQWVALQWLKHKKPSPPPATESDSGFSMDTAVTAVTAVTQSVSRSVNAVSSMITSNTGTGTGTGSDTPTAPPVVVHPSEPWKLSFTELNIEQGEVRLDDRAPSPRGVRLTLSDLSLKTHNFNPTGTEPIPLRLSARVRSSRDLDKLEPGYLYYSGSIQWNPVLLRQGVLDLQAVPLHVLAPYLANYINFSVERADTNYKGTLELAISPEGELQLKTLGDAALNNWNLQTISNKGVYEDLLHWGSLQLPGIDLQITPHKATQFRLRNATLSDFYARIEIDSNGRLNLQKLYKALPPPPEDAPASIPADIALGAIQVINGAVAFSDFHITPNYSANLSQLQGKISQFSSTPTMGDIQLADVTISGKAEGSALLELTGKINPLAKPLVMNIRGKVRDLDLPALNAYSEKHMGYVIDNGKLNLDVEYEIQPNGDLVANNQLVLKQLALTEKEDDSITKLPLKLAISLLSDRNGVVHMDLPISGSLKDPDFQITTVLWEIFRNLILKTLTAPFSLLAKVFGGDDNNTDWNSIYFAPGSSALNSTAMQVLNQQVELLAIRPKLNVSITGEAYLAADKEALRREQLRNVVLSEKRRRAVRDESLNTGLITQEEYDDLLRIIYRRSDIPKPRNWIGLEKDMPIKEVEEAMLGSIVITEESIRELALQRGNAVKDYLLRHKLDAKRIYLQAPRTQNPETDWKPRVQLGIKENQE